MPDNVVQFTPSSELLPLNSCVRVFRQKVDGAGAWTTGILLDASKELLLLQIISDQIELNGYQIIRRRDVSHIERPAPQQEFMYKALELRQQAPRHPGVLDLETAGSALKTTGRLYPLITVHQEITDPSICWIGRVHKITDDVLYLQCISPDAKLEPCYDTYDIELITRIDFGGAYEEALWMVYSN